MGLWKIPATLPYKDKIARMEITFNYGYRTIYFVSGLICLIALFNYMIPNVFKGVSRINSPSRRAQAFLYWSKRGSTTYTLVPTMLLVVAVLTAFTTLNINFDLLYLTKRCGRICVALMPPMYFLTMKPSPFPNSFYLDWLPLHKWISRLSILFAVVHAITYTYAYYVTGKLSKLLLVSNIAGIIALAGFLAIAITSLKPFRRNVYKVFYTVHIVTAWVCILLISMHALPSCTGYMECCLIIMIAQLFLRFYLSVTSKLPVQYLSSSLLLISIPLSALPPRYRRFGPGSHVRISNPLACLTAWTEASHPYTIASLPPSLDEQETRLQLIVRKSNYKIKLRQRYAIMGPFSALSKQFNFSAEHGLISRALFVVGGSGIAFAAPVFRYLKNLGIPCKILWAIRDPQDARAIKPLKLHDSILSYEIEIYFTGGPKTFREDTRRHSGTFGTESSDDDGKIQSQLSKQPSYGSIFKGNRSSDNQSETNQIFNENEENVGVDVNDICCLDNENVPLVNTKAGGSVSSRNRGTYDSIMMNDLLKDYAAMMYNNRPVLNLRMKTWLCGLSTDDDECCCVDQLVNVNAEDKSGAYVISAGNPRLVGDTKKWATHNGFSFYQEEYAM